MNTETLTIYKFSVTYCEITDAAIGEKAEKIRTGYPASRDHWKLGAAYDEALEEAREKCRRLNEAFADRGADCFFDLRRDGHPFEPLAIPGQAPSTEEIPF